MPQIVKREVSTLLPLIFVCLLFQGTEPMVNADFCQLLAPLRGKDIGALWIASTVLKILEEWSPSLVDQIDVAEFAALVSNVQPPNLWSHMGMIYEEMSN